MGYLFLIVALTLNAAANVLLKIGATRLGGIDEPGLLGRLVSDYYLLAGLLLFALNVVFYVAALARLNLSTAYPIMVAGGIGDRRLGLGIRPAGGLDAAPDAGLGLLVVGIALVGQRSFV